MAGTPSRLHGDDKKAEPADGTWGQDLPKMLGGTRAGKRWQTLRPRPRGGQLCAEGNQLPRGSSKEIAATGCGEQHQDRPDHPHPLPHQGYGIEDQGEEAQHGRPNQHPEDPRNRTPSKHFEYLQNDDRDLLPYYHDNKANPHSYRYTPKGTSEAETKEWIPTATGHKPAKYGHHTKEDGENEILHQLLILVYQPEHKATSEDTTSNGTGHTATEANVRRACEKGTEGPRDGRSDQRDPQVGTNTTTTTTATTATSEGGSTTRARPYPCRSRASLRDVHGSGEHLTRTPGCRRGHQAQEYQRRRAHQPSAGDHQSCRTSRTTQTTRQQPGATSFATDDPDGQDEHQDGGHQL